jgi:FkbM family methyltransferase
MKKMLRSSLDYVFRRFPVSRSVYAERDALKEHLPTAQDVALFLKRTDSASRNQLFDAFREVGLSEHLYVELDRECFLVNAQDEYISRELFVSGCTDFSKFEIAVDLLKQHNENADVFELIIDVGANIGSVCIPVVMRGIAKRAIAIEPHPTNCRLLHTNIAINGLRDQIEVVERAASTDDDSPLPMEISKDNWGDHRIFCSNEPGIYEEEEREQIEVRSIMLDSIKGVNAGMHMLLWMDIQGYEGHALCGAKVMLAEKPPLILEFWPYGMMRAKSFSPLCHSIAHYRGFFDLNNPAHPLRPLDELNSLFDEIGPTGRFTDILVI